MLNGQNNFNAGGPPGNGGFPNMVGTQGGAQGMQYGMGPGARGMQGQAPPPNARGQFVPGVGAQGQMGGGMGMGAQGGMQSPFGNPMGQGNGLSLGGGPPPGLGSPTPRGTLERAGSGTLGGAPPGLQRAGSGNVASAQMGGRPGGMMGGGGSFGQPGGGIPRPTGPGGAGGVGGGGGADLLAMINKQQGGANLQAFGGGAQGNLMGIGGMGSGVGMGGMMGAPDEPAPGFDLNEFPSLGGPPLPNARGPGAQFGHGVGGGLGMGPGPQMGGMFGGMDGMGSADGYGVVALQKPHPEFTIQNEDFPALPGAPGGGGGGPKPDDGKGGQSGPQGNFPPMSRGGSGAFPSLGGGVGQKGPGGGLGLDIGGGYLGADGGGPFGVVQGGLGGQYPSLHSQGSGASSQGGYDFGGGGGAGTRSASSEAKGGVPPKPMGSPDRYGLLGLLSVIRMSDPDLTTLALGTDLTTLGLNLNSPEPLYKTFGSPWADTPPRPELELLLPACYGVQVSRCHVSVFQKFQQETLFYVFYSMPGDEAQLYAADELVARGWGFHKELKAWIMRVAGTEPVTKNERGERGSFWIFDVLSWERVRKDNFNLQYDQLEARPQVPRGKDAGGGGKDAPAPFLSGAALAAPVAAAK